MALSQRKEWILSAVVEFYIETGEPVGSKYLVSVLPVAVSSATVRNEMADLSEMGYLEQPHTSAGRIPSEKGLRYYADRLLPRFAPSPSEMLRISSGIDHFEGDARVLLTQACDVLSQLTGAMAVAVTPYFPGAVISNVQLLPIGTKSAVVVFSTSAGVFRSKIAKLQTPPDYELYELFYNVCAANFVGAPLTSLTRAHLQKAVLSLGARALDVAPLLVSLFEAIAECAEADVIARGQSALLSSELAADAPKIIELTANKDAMIRLLRENVSGEPKIRIGAENGYPFMRAAAVLTSPYTAGGAEAGAIAVIGSVKTDYAHVLPLVKYVSDVIGTLLSGEPDTTERKD